MAEYILSPSKADPFEWHILVAGGKNLIQIPQKDRWSFPCKTITLGFLASGFLFFKIVGFLFFFLSFLTLAVYLRSDVCYLKLKSKGVIGIDHWKSV